MTATAFPSLVSPAEGRINRRIFTDPDVYRLEQERIFARSWLLVGHESQIPLTGDFVTTTMGEDPIIVVRQKDGDIAAMLNTCRHRGMKVCRVDNGRAKNFSCAYHGWTYGTDGTLVSVPEQASYGARFDRSARGLIRVPHVTNYKGLIFANWDENAASLTDYLGEMAWYLDAFVDRLPAGTEVLPGVQRWKTRGNWKLAAEQFASDVFHAPYTHGSALQAIARDLPGDVMQSFMEMKPVGIAYGSDRGHGAIFATDAAINSPATLLVRQAKLHGYYQDREAEFVAHLGHDRAHGPLGANATIFPNASYLSGVSNTLRVWHPRGPNHMEIEAWVIVDKDAPPEIKEEQRIVALRTFGPSGLLEQDDGENWAEIQAVFSAGVIQDRHDLDYAMAIETPPAADDRFPGPTGPMVNELPARAFYARWQALMASE